ncbi:methyltransferase domain-containing protein [Wenzhouxiangella sediminis]|uniref:Methyltransferase domain-containing protein n=1 Tax=Wenzhouxiangella sediminis TaxID=1792836 RepID=A0A3E1KE11_9GAMM|nr:methyltransferase domain-containing protein [Wenzhouxiangella sediminis]
MDLDRVGRHCSLLGDATRLRLLALLETEELTVAELAQITRLAQPRVSTHLARLREAGLVVDRRDGVSVYYRLGNPDDNPELHRLWTLFRDGLDDAVVSADAERLPEIMAQRAAGRNWPDSVAGDMERHYSPGRTWEATTRALVQLLSLGRVLDVASGDGVMGELLARQAERIDCVDVSEKVVAAGRERVKPLTNVQFHLGDMHALPFDDDAFDSVLMMHALTYSDRPQAALAEAARTMKPGGRLVGATLRKHRHSAQVKTFGHANNGFTPRQLAGLIEKAGLDTAFCDVTSVERKTPNFEIITFLAEKP